jgi:polyhydroxyalkanoate synthesis regulator phasin
MFRTILARTAGLIAAGALAATVALGVPAPAAAAPASSPAAVQSQHPGDRGGRIAVATLIRITADLTDTTASAVRDAVIGGQSLAQYAAANGSSGEAVVDAAVDKATPRIEQAVQRGRITREQADRLIQELTDRATALVNDTELGAKLKARRG